MRDESWASRLGREESVFVWVIAIWLFAVLYFDPRILALLWAKSGWVGKVGVLAFVGCLNFFWFFTIYFIVVIIVSNWLRYRRPTETSAVPRNDFPGVAILYPTRNDFRPDAVENLLQMDYPNFRIFILDDSTLEDFKRRIDDWVAKHSDKASLIRRPVHQGFKAGNVNYALRQVGSDYPYFVICDNDNILPHNFITELLPYFDSEPMVGFVQAAQAASPAQTDPFGQAMGCNVAIHFRHYVRARQAYGFVMFYGHGALIKTSVWQEIGGFPEIVTEDLSFSAIIRTKGYHGIYSEKVVCLEDYPPTYGQLRKRTEKWIRGTAEFLKLYYRQYLKSPNVTWFEKLDVLVHSTTHFTAVFMLLFLFVLGFILPASYDFFRYPGSFFFMPVPEGKSALNYLINVRYHIFWSWDFFVIMILTVFLPTIPVSYDLRREPGKALRFVVAANFVYLASLVVETLDFLAYFITGKAHFRNTHDAADRQGGSLKDVFSGYHANHPLVFVAELLVGAFFIFMCFRNKNIWFSVPGTALLLSPLIHWIGWERRWVRALTWIPFLIGVFIVSVVTMNLVVDSWAQFRAHSVHAQ